MKRDPAPSIQRRAPTSAKAEQRVRDILRVGREVFAELGYERTTTTEIAQRLAISEATIFTYFRGKRELCLRVIGDWYDETIATIEATLPPDSSTREQLEAFVRIHLSIFLVQGTGICALVLSEGRSRPGAGPDLGDTLHELQRRYTAPLMDLLARGQVRGEIRADLPLRLLRSLVLGPIEHMLWELLASPQRNIDIEASTRDLVALLWQAVQAPDQELQALRGLRHELQKALDRV
ncbi:TetR/AcrR family transcriptional regulator [Pelomonas sp. KK5]|uniref:TetR/AcrR family transcriptional regulator n=1 Tax=Pelomonas sp. KK5 TaxID=1855730 RepID=UPI001E3A7ABD|nr:TetR/AcrR family transcriptional regulator [Pelomonas sp. KK5]